MKRLTALALCLTTVFTLGTSVSADTLSSIAAGGNTSNQQVKGTYRGDTNVTVYSVDIEWSNFNFEKYGGYFCFLFFMFHGKFFCRIFSWYWKSGGSGNWNDSSDFYSRRDVLYFNRIYGT